MPRKLLKMDPEEIISRKFSLRNIRQLETKFEEKKFRMRLESEPGRSSTPKGKEERKRDLRIGQKIMIMRREVEVKKEKKENEEKEKMEKERHDREKLKLMNKRMLILKAQKKTRLELKHAETELLRMKLIAWKVDRMNEREKMLGKEENKLIHLLYEQVMEEEVENSEMEGLDEIKMRVQEYIKEMRKEKCPVLELIKKWEEEAFIKMEVMQAEIENI